MRVEILTLAIVIAALAAPFVILSVHHDAAFMVLTEPARALDLFDLR